MSDVFDDTLIYVCDPEYCDDGFHVTAPLVESGWRIGAAAVEEYQSFDNSFYYIPGNAGLVKSVVAWRMECGTWFLNEPERKTLKEYRDEMRFDIA